MSQVAVHIQTYNLWLCVKEKYKHYNYSIKVKRCLSVKLQDHTQLLVPKGERLKAAELGSPHTRNPFCVFIYVMHSEFPSCWTLFWIFRFWIHFLFYFEMSFLVYLLLYFLSFSCFPLLCAPALMCLTCVASPGFPFVFLTWHHWASSSLFEILGDPGSCVRLFNLLLVLIDKYK